ncbi:MAG: class I SAM-dependent methyltransferase [Desulfamplus sp.]|nr:class I SAM-dependent methyltransferase [Desulfamplus sp.]
MICESELKGIITDRWSARAKTYDMSPGHGIHSDQEKQAWLEILSGALDYKKDLKILDVGTGTGALALLFAEMNHKVTGIDLSENMLNKAREKASKGKLKAEFKVGDAETPPFEEESFDAIACRHLLWTIPNPDKAVNSWKNILKPGGRLIIIDGNFGRNNKRTMLQEIWRYAAMPLIFFTEFRNPRMPQKDLDAHLPMRSRERPAADVNMLESAGFKVKVTEVDIPRKYSLISYMKYGYSKHSKYQFVVTGVKEGK